MNKKNILFVLLIILISCQQKTKKHYYDTGELMYETNNIKTQEGIFNVKEYYRNGILKAKGDCQDVSKGKNHPIGHWKEYYSDGVLKWEGDYDQGQRIISKDGKWPDFIKIPAQVSIEGSPSILKLGQSYKIRILMPQVHSSLYIVIDENKHRIPANKQDPEKYPYIITPNTIGKVHYFILFPNKDGYYIIGNQMRLFELTVEK